MFQFPSLAPFGHPVLPGWGFPIRKSRGQTLVCQLTRAYRRLLRPSSPPNAKAFTVCPSIIHTKTISLKSTDTNLIVSEDIASTTIHICKSQRTKPIPRPTGPEESVVEKQAATSIVYRPCPLIRRFEDWTP